MSHEWTLRFLEHRIADKRILRLIAKWLKAGVVAKDGHIERSTRGAPQGAVVSPILANVYLHYALDLWVYRWRQEKARGDVIVIRYADDFIAGFQHEHEAKAFLQDLGGTVSYRRFSAPYKLALQAAGIARVYALPPWNRLDLVAIRQR